MALTQEIQDESDLAKSYVANSDLDDDYKKTLLRLIHISTLTTNGISPEEKIQKMTEAIHLLAISQVTFITKIDEKIEKSIQNANIKQCSGCKAMKHAIDVEEEEKWKEKLAEYKEKMGNTEIEFGNFKKTINGFASNIQNDISNAVSGAVGAIAQKDVEEEEKWKEKLSEYKQKMGITDDNDSKNTQKTDETSIQTNISMLDTIKQICLKPYVWIFGSVLVFSPYGMEILKTLIQCFGK